jgi:hypothetical protein
VDGVVSDFEGRKKLCTDVRVTELLPLNDFSPITELISALVSLTLDPTVSTASQRSEPTCSATSEQNTTTLAIKKKVKSAHFVEGIKDNEHVQGGVSRIIEFPTGSEQLQKLIQELHFCPTLKHAIEILPAAAMTEIAFSLNMDIAIRLSGTAFEIRRRANSRAEAICLSHELEPYKQLHKQYLLSFLDNKTHQRYLCRDCKFFHDIPERRYNGKAPTFEKNCATRFVVGADETKNHHLFDASFRFSQIQYAMKLFRQGMAYGDRLRPLIQSTKMFYIPLSHISTSEAYPVAESGGRLFNRIQHWYHTSPDIQQPLSKAELLHFCTRFRNQGGIINLCHHLTTRHHYERKHGHIIWDFENPDTNPIVRRCRDCALEYRYDWYDAGEYGNGLVLTLWRDLGQCLTPFDPRWAAHFKEYENAVYIAKFGKDLGASRSDSSHPATQEYRWHEDMEPAASNWDEGEIQKMFEAGAGFDLQGCVQMMKKCVKTKEGPFESLPRLRKDYFQSLSPIERKELLGRGLVGRAPTDSSGST